MCHKTPNPTGLSVGFGVRVSVPVRLIVDAYIIHKIIRRVKTFLYHIVAQASSVDTTICGVVVLSRVLRHRPTPVLYQPCLISVVRCGVDGISTVSLRPNGMFIDRHSITDITPRRV